MSVQVDGRSRFAVVKIGSIVERTFIIPLVEVDNGWWHGFVPRDGKDQQSSGQEFLLRLHPTQQGNLVLRRVSLGRHYQNNLRSVNIYPKGDGISFESKPDSEADEFTPPINAWLYHTREGAEQGLNAINRDGRSRVPY